MHHYRYLKNLSDHHTNTCETLTTFNKTPKKFTDKEKRRAWMNHPDTDYVFYSLNEGTIASTRISKRGGNKVEAMYGFVVEYDNIDPDWDKVVEEVLSKCGPFPPTVITRTPSGGIRLIWEFEGKLLIDYRMFNAFVKALADKLRVRRMFAGFDESCLDAAKYWFLGEIIHVTEKRLKKDFYKKLLIKTSIKHPPQAPTALSIPLEVIEKEVRENEKYKGRWTSGFNVGDRGPLFWIDDGIERDGCQVTLDGMVCYSDRAGKGFLTWKEIFGQTFVDEYENAKLDHLVDKYWFTGKAFYTFINGKACTLDKDQLKLELRQAGFRTTRNGQPLTEVENAILIIQQNSRIDEVAPIIFDERRIVESGPNKILNTSTLKPVQPAGDADRNKWKFIDTWLTQFFKDKESLDYFYGWLQRIYSALYEKQSKQGHALILVGPTNKGKSLLSNKLIGGLLGGFADASDYLSGDSKFNKELGRVAAWVIDDTTSAASFAEQRRATELIKKATANPRIEYQAKFEDTITISWAGRVIMSLNMDPTSLSVIPALDSSNRDKILALRISDKAESNFAKLLGVEEASNTIIESRIAEELPYFAQWLLHEFKVPKHIKGDSRFGIKSFIDPEIEEVAFANSTRSILIETVEFFVRKFRDYDDKRTVWKGFATDFMQLVTELNGGKPLNNLVVNTEFMRRSMQSLEEACKADPTIRPVTSQYKKHNKIYSIDLDPKWDISDLDD